MNYLSSILTSNLCIYGGGGGGGGFAFLCHAEEGGNDLWFSEPAKLI